MEDSVRDALALIARHVQAFLNGKTGALHELCDILLSGRFSEETVKEALETIIELAIEEAELEEKESLLETRESSYNAEKLPLSPEAHVYLSELRSSGAINTLTERALMEKVAVGTTGEVSVEDIKKAMVEVVADPYTSFLLSSENLDNPTIH
jgi:FtsZ-binding cell division protein ZapB